MIAMSKPAYLAIVEYAPTRPVIIFVSSRKQCRSTVDDLLVHCAADDRPDRFMNAEEADLQRYLDRVSDKRLVESLKHGIGYYHEAMDKQDKRIIEYLFESGAIQVLVASKVSFVMNRSLSTNWKIGHSMEHPGCELHGNRHGRPILRGQGTPLC